MEFPASMLAWAQGESGEHLTRFHDRLTQPHKATASCISSRQQPWAFLSAFWNGALEAAGPDVRIIDGHENAYYFTKREQFVRARDLIRRRSLSLVPPELHAKHAVTVQAGMALYMDQVLALREPREKHLNYYLTPAERLQWFEHNVYYALSHSDEYVWCYSERMNWWQAKVPNGAEDAIRSARDKSSRGQDLGFEIADFIAAGNRKMSEAAKANNPPQEERKTEKKE